MAHGTTSRRPTKLNAAAISSRSQPIGWRGRRTDEERAHDPVREEGQQRLRVGEVQDDAREQDHAEADPGPDLERRRRPNRSSRHRGSLMGGLCARHTIILQVARPRIVTKCGPHTCTVTRPHGRATRHPPPRPARDARRRRAAGGRHAEGARHACAHRHGPSRVRPKRAGGHALAGSRRRIRPRRAATHAVDPSFGGRRRHPGHRPQPRWVWTSRGFASTSAISSALPDP